MMAEVQDLPTDDTSVESSAPLCCRYCAGKFSTAKEVKDHQEAVHDQ